MRESLSNLETPVRRLPFPDVDPRELGFDQPAYTMREAMAATGLSNESLYKGIRAGSLSSFMNGGRRMFLARDLAAFMLGRIRLTEAMTQGRSPIEVALEIYRATRKTRIQSRTQN